MIGFYSQAQIASRLAWSKGCQPPDTALYVYQMNQIKFYFGCGRYNSTINIDIGIITGLSNGPVLFCSVASVVVVCHLLLSVTLLAGGRAGLRARGRSGGRHCTAGQYGYVPLGRHLIVILSLLQPKVLMKALSFQAVRLSRPFLCLSIHLEKSCYHDIS